MKRFLLITLLCCLATILLAQKIKSQRCAPQGKVRSYFSQRLWRGYFEADGGLSIAVPYKDPDAKLDNGFCLKTKPRVYLGLSYNFSFLQKLELFCGFRYMRVKHGLAFQFDNGQNPISYEQYSGSYAYRLSAGLSFLPLQNVKISLAPALVYSNNDLITHTISGYQNNHGYEFRWSPTSFYHTWYGGADLKFTYSFYKNWDLHFLYSMDLAPSTPLSGQVILRYSNGDERNYTGTVNHI